ncbi:hypothetical protein SLS53_004702 [Cytospora paraplurivora]|uniref:Elongation of fatty acids protein n=1 Tax=Cytospora paraplurivora TaxID=2898453 RepID=A0AAN9YH67_9PEZI
MDISHVYATAPDPLMLKSMFPPNSLPEFLPPPAPGSVSSAPPFLIPDHIYRAALDPRVPITIAAAYAVTAKLLNKYNTANGKKPWALSKTRAFHAFVVAHNVFLAVYSAWTFYGMVGVMRRSVVNPLGPQGLNGFVDSMTRLHGPGGLGNAIYYSEPEGRWVSDSSNVSLGSDGLPSRTDLGRIWNEGLAFYGWIFYLSKFYEVLDTFIILAKGKLSSTLQTYHHAGAMMCMWAGMRYMSAPIWMFAFVNSGIHALMYTYYTLSVFNVHVPLIVKRTLTSLQITQFLVGASYAMIHSFVSYDVPVETTIVRSSTSTATSAAIGSDVTGAASTGSAFLDNLKQLVFGAAFKVPTSALAHEGAPQYATSEETVYAHKVVPAITTTGQSFAIWLNVLYLAPLTYLFVKFFITSYIKRSGAEAARKGKGKTLHQNHVTVAEKAGWDAAQGLQNEVYGTQENGRVNGGASNSKANGSPNGRVLKPVTNQRHSRHA